MEAILLHQAVSFLRPRRILELGTFAGTKNDTIDMHLEIYPYRATMETRLFCLCHGRCSVQASWRTIP